MTIPDWEREARLRPLLGHLATAGRPDDEEWQGWRIGRIGGGANNLLYRARGEGLDLAVKFTIRDERDRAGREYGALLALHRAGLRIAPEPLLLDRATYELPVVVQTWLSGEVPEAPPATDTQWRRLLEHLAMVHSVTAATSDVPLRRAYIDAGSAEAARALVRWQVEHIPATERPVSLRRLLRRLESAGFPVWSRPPAALCRVDANTRNFVRRPGLWASVDWEYSGWGDPSFEIAQMMVHPAYIGVPAARWRWLVNTVCTLGDYAPVRIWTYYRVMLVFWVARMARFLYEVPLGLDERLAAPPDGWEADRLAKYEHYLGLAQAWL